MNMSLGELWAKVQNYVDPILAGIITLTVLNLAGLGLVYYVYNLPMIEHPLDPVVAADREPYEPMFTEQVKQTDLSETATRLATYNFFVPGQGFTPPRPIDPDPNRDPDDTRDQQGGQEVPPPVEQQISKVTYHGGVFAGGIGVAQLSSEEASDPLMVFMVKVGNTIPGTDIRLKQIDRYYVVLTRPGFKDTQVPVRGAIQIPAPGAGPSATTRPLSRRRSVR